MPLQSPELITGVAGHQPTAVHENKVTELYIYFAVEQISLTEKIIRKDNSQSR